jgi:hypothetical protein
MFADHLLEVLDHFQRDVVFLVSEIHERSGVNAVLGHRDFDRAVWIDNVFVLIIFPA